MPNVKNTYVKVVVQNKKHPKIFESFMEGIYKEDPFSVNIVTNFLEVIEAEVETLDQSDDTVTIMKKYVDRLHKANPTFDLNSINKILLDIYSRAINEDNI